MTDSGLDLVTGGGEPPKPPRSSRPGARRAEKPPRKPWGKRIVALVVVIVLVWLAFLAYGKIKDRLSGPADYTGQGSGKVVVTIPKGAGGSEMADILYKADVVKSAEAFYQLSLNDARFQGIQAATYQLRKHMSADWAMRELSDTSNIVQTKVTIPEGYRIGQIVEAVAKNTSITEKQMEAALKKPSSYGLPAAAKDNPEGYLFPATYEVPPDMTATQLLKQMVTKTVAVEKSLDVSTKAQALGLTEEQVLTVASILEYEAKKSSDYPKVARVLYNRLKANMPLQLDSTVSYVSKRKGDVFTTQAERDDQSAYNTYQHTGLPPGPIGSAGEETIKAALNPADGTWLYFVAVNLDTGETVFSDTYAEHQKAVAQLQEYCKTSSAC